MKKVINEYYVLVTYIGNDALYVTEDYGFDDDIHKALKAKSRITAKFLKNNMEIKHKCYFDIVPIKVTYEW